MLNEQPTGFSTSNGQTFVPGVQGFTNASIPRAVNANAVSPNAIRWMFNPFAVVNVTTRPISGHAWLRAGVFIPITNQVDRQSVSGISASPGAMFDWQNGNQPEKNGIAEPGAPVGSYRDVTRTAFAISSEIEDAYTERGVRVLPSLTKFEDFDAVTALHRTLIADGLNFNADPYQPEFPVPNLIFLENYLAGTAMQIAAKLGNDLQINPVELVKDVLVSVRQAKKLCIEVTREAKRTVANKTIGYVHAFDAYQSRCFIALGEQVPSDLPFVSASGQMTAAGASMSESAEMTRLRAENDALKSAEFQRQIDELKAENDKLKAARPINDADQSDLTEPTADVKCDAVKSNGEQCKMNATSFGRCGKHPRESENVENADEIQGVE